MTHTSFAPTFLSRRTLQRVAAGSLLTLLPAAAIAQGITPAQAEGPFYPLDNMRFEDQDNDLVKIAGQPREAEGEVFYLRGKVLNGDGNPIAGARIEIWQVDANARYLHTGDRADRPRDPNFQGFGFAISDAEGNYEFRTIKPLTYPGRTPHIHVKAFAGNRALTTQFFIKDDPANANDGSWRRLSQAQRAAVSMDFKQGSKGLEAVVDIRFSS